MFPGKYHQNGACFMAMLVYRRVISTNGNLVVWVGGLGFEPGYKYPFHEGDPICIQTIPNHQTPETINSPLAELLRSNTTADG